MGNCKQKCSLCFSTPKAYEQVHLKYVRFNNGLFGWMFSAWWVPRQTWTMSCFAVARKHQQDRGQKWRGKNKTCLGVVLPLKPFHSFLQLTSTQRHKLCWERLLAWLALHLWWIPQHLQICVLTKRQKSDSMSLSPWPWRIFWHVWHALNAITLLPMSNQSFDPVRCKTSSHTKTKWHAVNWNNEGAWATHSDVKLKWAMNSCVNVVRQDSASKCNNQSKQNASTFFFFKMQWFCDESKKEARKFAKVKPNNSDSHWTNFQCNMAEPKDSGNLKWVLPWGSQFGHWWQIDVWNNRKWLLFHWAQQNNCLCKPKKGRKGKSAIFWNCTDGCAVNFQFAHEQEKTSKSNCTWTKIYDLLTCKTAQNMFHKSLCWVMKMLMISSVVNNRFCLENYVHTDLRMGESSMLGRGDQN